MARYSIGIDLGTTNSAVAYVDLREKPGPAGPKLHAFAVPQLVGPGQVQDRPLLPSFLYLPGLHDLPAGATALPWLPNATEVVGTFARNQGAKVPGRQVTSAKSWLGHAGVDRTSPLLPWAAPPDVPRLSPLEVSTRYLTHLVQAWNHAPGRRPEDFLEEQTVVVTVPASFDDTARNLTAEAAKKAGLKNVLLLEEPQAAFYAWLGTHPPQEANALKPGMKCVVVDVGGGTSDFSLIGAVEGQGELEFVRDAVGDHLLLGGDNMDLALAKSVEAKWNKKLDAAQFGGLVQACRAAKEVLLGDSAPESVPVTVVGQGRSVVGGTISTTLTVADVHAVFFDGFFPACSKDAEPSRAKVGLQEMGLPYVSDPAITKHLASFLARHGGDSPPDAILFNGGVFQPDVLRQRLVQVMAAWYGPQWKPLVLSSPSLDLAVAWGAAFFAWLKHTGGKRIGGGIPRAYYVGLDSQDPTLRTVLCVVPRRLQEGEEIALTKPELELALGEPVLFPLFTSTVRGDDKPGDVLHLQPNQLLPLPPLHTVLRGGKRTGVKRVPVTLAAKCTEIGTLELACVSREGNRWRLEFNVRDVLQMTTPDEEADATRNGVQEVFPEERIQAASDKIRACFEANTLPPQELVKELETVLEMNRSEWPSGLCRRLSEPLLEVAERRGRSPAHLARWYNLVGFCLRPGFGDPLDRYRVDNVWKIVTATAAGAKTATIPEGGADYWIMWRRLAGGLPGPLQQALFGKIRPTLLPAKGKAYSKPHPNEYAEMWRVAAALERLDSRTKEALAEPLLRQARKSPVPTYAFWSLTRLGARVPFAGPLNAIVHPDTLEPWVKQLLEFVPSTDGERLGWGFALSQLARCSGMRAVDLPDWLRQDVAEKLRQHDMPAAWPRMVLEAVGNQGDDQSQLFGEALPLGLRLV